MRVTIYIYVLLIESTNNYYYATCMNRLFLRSKNSSGLAYLRRKSLNCVTINAFSCGLFYN